MTASEAAAVASATLAGANSGLWSLGSALFAAAGVIVVGLITSIASIAAMRMQQRGQNQRDLVRMAVDLGMAEYAQDVTFARDRAAQGQLSPIAPLATYVLISAQLLDMLKEGKLTPDAIRTLEAQKTFPGNPGPAAGEREQ